MFRRQDDAEVGSTVLTILGVVDFAVLAPDGRLRDVTGFFARQAVD